MSGYYVMREADGDELLLFHKPTLEEAIAAAEDYGKTALDSESLSVWSVDGGGIVWMPQGVQQ